MHIHAILLAAGASKRFNGIKQLAPVNTFENIAFDEQTNTRPQIAYHASNQATKIKPNTMLASVLYQYQLAEFTTLSCVLGANAEPIKKNLDINSIQTNNNFESVEFVQAPNWSHGMGASIADALQHIPKTTTHVCIGLADQIAITFDALQKLKKALEHQPKAIIASKFGHELGPPCIFPKSYFAQLKSLKEDVGARFIIKQHSKNVVHVNIPAAQIDIDTQEDYAKHLASRRTS